MADDAQVVAGVRHARTAAVEEHIEPRQRARPVRPEDAEAVLERMNARKVLVVVIDQDAPDDPHVVTRRADGMHSVRHRPLPFRAVHEDSLLRAAGRAPACIGPRIGPCVQEAEHPVALAHLRHLDDHGPRGEIEPCVGEQGVVVRRHHFLVVGRDQLARVRELVDPPHRGARAVACEAFHRMPASGVRGPHPGHLEERQRLDHLIPHGGGNLLGPAPDDHRIQCKRPFALRQHGEGIHVHGLEAIPRGNGEFRQPHDRLCQGLDVGLRCAPEAVEQGPGLELADHAARLVEVHRREAEGHVPQQLRVHPAGAEHHDVAEHRITVHAEDAFDAAHHPRRQDAVDAGLWGGDADRVHDPVVGGSGTRRIGHAERDSAHVALVRDVAGQDLHRHGIAEFLRGGDGFAPRAGSAHRHHGHAMGLQQLQCIGFVASAGPQCDRSGGGAGGRTARVLRVLPEEIHGREYADGAARVREGEAAELFQGALLLRVGQGAEHHQAARKITAQVAGELQLDLLHRRREARGREEHEQAAVAAAAEHGIGSNFEKIDLGGDLARHVDRIAGRGKGHAVEDPSLRRLGQGRDVESGFRSGIREQHAHAAGDGEQADLAIRRHARDRQAMCDIEELVDGPCPPGAVLAKERVERGVVAGQCRRVRGRRHRTERRSPDLHDDDRLAGRARQAERMLEPGAVVAAFHVGHDDARCRILRHPCDAFGHVDIAFVAGGNPGRQPHVALARHAVGVGTECAALRDDADRSRRCQSRRQYRRESRVDAPAGIHEAEAVGPQHPHALGTRARHDAALRLAAFGPGLREAAGEDHDVPDACGDRIVQRGFRQLGRNGEDREIDGPAHVPQVAIGAHPVHLRRARVDRVDLSRIAVVEEVAKGRRPDLAGRGGGADDGNGAGREEGVQVWRGHGLLQFGGMKLRKIAAGELSDKLRFPTD
ncbi:hypothetical protein APY03_0367 [Variovorax sp. WDL1]|nr:hypothetical protein APY03_0367 [Variovorax sp. WDL1]